MRKKFRRLRGFITYNNCEWDEKEGKFFEVDPTVYVQAADDCEALDDNRWIECNSICNSPISGAICILKRYFDW